MIRSAIALLAAATLGACSGEETHEAESPTHSGGHAHGPHGGHMIEIGAHIAHLEVVHDEEAGKLTIYVLEADAQTPHTVTKPPQLKLATPSGPRVIETEARDETNTVFTVTDAALETHEPEGRISIEVKDKTYNPDLEHHH